jgi:hypothetical protein
MFSGTNGFGVRDIPTEHSKVMTEKCVECHYFNVRADNTILEKGGHTFRIDDRVCVKCHHNTAQKVSEWETKIAPLTNQLKELLDKYPDKKSNGYYNASRNYGMVIGDSGMNIYGIHNPQYAEALLKKGIAILTSESTWKQ